MYYFFKKSNKYSLLPTIAIPNIMDMWLINHILYHVIWFINHNLHVKRQGDFGEAWAKLSRRCLTCFCLISLVCAAYFYSYFEKWIKDYSLSTTIWSVLCKFRTLRRPNTVCHTSLTKFHKPILFHENATVKRHDAA